jgi:hypothetical protein
MQALLKKSILIEANDQKKGGYAATQTIEANVVGQKKKKLPDAGYKNVQETESISLAKARTQIKTHAKVFL